MNFLSICKYSTCHNIGRNISTRIVLSCLGKCQLLIAYQPFFCQNLCEGTKSKSIRIVKNKMRKPGIMMRPRGLFIQISYSYMLERLRQLMLSPILRTERPDGSRPSGISTCHFSILLKPPAIQVAKPDQDHHRTQYGSMARSIHPSKPSRISCLYLPAP